MSKYKIYRIDHHDPVWVGKRRRRLNIIFAALAIISAPGMIIIHNIFKIGIGETNLILIFTLMGFYLLFYLKLKSENKNIKTIGDIEFTKIGIIRHIGDSFIETKYDSIYSVEIQKHIPALTIKESKSGFFTYILSIYFKDSHKETLIVSDRSFGKLQDLSITETIKTLKKLYFYQDLNKITKR
ncbi:MAG: hypothetical protein ACM3RX_08420 [Methanococcaceae archaeon]